MLHPNVYYTIIIAFSCFCAFRLFYSSGTLISSARVSIGAALESKNLFLSSSPADESPSSSFTVPERFSCYCCEKIDNSLSHTFHCAQCFARNFFETDRFSAQSWIEWKELQLRQVILPRIKATFFLLDRLVPSS